MKARGGVASTPCEFGGFTNRAGQVAHGSRWVSVWVTPIFSVLKLSFASFFRYFPSGDHLVAVGRSSGVPVVFRSQDFEYLLHLMAIFGPAVVSFVQYEPEFETRVGSADVNAVSFA